MSKNTKHVVGWKPIARAAGISLVFAAACGAPSFGGTESDFRPGAVPGVMVRHVPAQAQAGAGGQSVFRAPGAPLPNPAGRPAAVRLMRTERGPSAAGGHIGHVDPESFPLVVAHKTRSGKVRIDCSEPQGRKKAVRRAQAKTKPGRRK